MTNNIPELAFVEMKPIPSLELVLSTHSEVASIELQGWRGLIQDFEGEGVGIDPGRNFGLSIMSGNALTVYYGKLPSRKSPFNFLSGWDAFHLSSQFVGVNRMPLVVEGAAHEEDVGQVLLAEIRAGFYIGMAYFNQCKVELVPPTKVRKRVWGKGGFKGGYAWPLINPNAADAGACALYAAGYEFRGGYSQEELE